MIDSNQLHYILSSYINFHRRCIHCSCRHCCNSWCKEEFVVVIEFLFLSAVHLIMYLPMLEQLTRKLELDLEFGIGISRIFEWVMPWLPTHVARGIEMSSGIFLPILCYTFLPAYRKFCNEPDPDDLKLSKPNGKT